MKCNHVLEKYQVGEVKKISQITSGLIHASYKVETPVGTYLLQRLNPTLENRSMVRNYDAVTTYLTKQRVQTQTVVKNVRGELLTKDEKNVWRLLTFVAGTVYESSPTPKQAYQVGQALGAFHLWLRGFHGRLEGKDWIHDTSRVLRRLQRLPKNALRSEVQHALTSALLPDGLPQTIIHGDPKLTNIVFPKKGDPVFVDLDTVRKGSVLLDLGDALRSWCKKSGANGMTIDLLCFRRALEGYRDGRGTWKLLRREQQLIVQAFQMIALELAARFLIDAVEQKLFAWDRKNFSSLAKQNQVRAQKMLQLAAEIERQRSKLETIVDTIFA